jgi:peptidoglycan/LPS O-acetylase OafA/YrhL
MSSAVTPQVRTEPRTPVNRHHWPALDTLRGLAMLLGVVLHASVSYMPHAMPDLLWAVRDAATHPIFDWLFWSIHSFRLPLFFAMAGFFTVQLHESRGTRGYLIHRSRRLLLPLMAASGVLLPLTFVVWACGWLTTGQCTFADIRRMEFRPEIRANLYGPAHLWFLEYLYLMCVLFAIVAWLTQRWSLQYLPSARWLDRSLSTMWFPLLPAVPAAALIFLSPTIISGFHNSFVPHAPRFAYYGIFFVTGIVLARARPHFDRCFGGRHHWLLVLCLPLLVTNVWLLRDLLDNGLSLASRLALATSLGLLASLSVFGFIGLALRWWSRERPYLRYLADASYWIYLVHFPIVGLSQVLVARMPVAAPVKFIGVLGGALAIALITYERFVRHTFLGRFLNGSRSSSGMVLSPGARRSFIAVAGEIPMCRMTSATSAERGSPTRASDEGDLAAATGPLRAD